MKWIQTKNHKVAVAYSKVIEKLEQVDESGEAIDLFNHYTDLLDGMGSFVVELDPGVWLSGWDGDPGRTLKRDHAKVYDSEIEAWKALAEARTYRTFKAAQIRPVGESILTN